MRRLIAVIATCSVACGGERGASNQPVVRDSAGIRIVENTGPVWTDDTRWRLSPEPVLTIGAPEAAPEYQMFRVRRIVRLGDGKIVVANAGTQEIRWYDAAGRHWRTAGSQGSGPGQFTGLNWISKLPGDSIIAWDDGLLRLSVFSPDADFVRVFGFDTRNVSGMERPAFVPPALGDGSLLVVGRVLNLQNLAEGPLIVPLILYRYASDGALLDSLDTFHGWESQVVIRRSEQVVQMAISNRPFAHSTTLTASPDRYFVGTPHAFEIAVHEPDGRLIALLRLLRSVEPVTEADIGTYQRLALENIEEENARRDRQRQLDEIEYPPTKPAFGSVLLTDANDNLWVSEFVIDPNEPGRWLVFDRDLALLGELTMPSRFLPYHIDRNTVLGVWRDEFDVEYVHGYELIKP